MKTSKIAPIKNKKHRCNDCHWGKNTGGTYFCMLPRCMPKLGIFNGVGRNVK